MNARIAVGVVAFCLATVAMALVDSFVTAMIGEINRKRCETDLVSHFWLTPAKMLRIFSEYRRGYPRGRLHILALTAFGVGVTALITIAACLGIIG